MYTIYNSLNENEEPVQLILDFQDDFAEREHLTKMKKKAA